MAFARHVTLTPNTAQQVDLDSNDYYAVEILNRNGLDEVFVSLGNTSATLADPTVGGNDTDVVPASSGAAIRLSRRDSKTIRVKLISASAATVSVRGVL